VFEFSHGLDPQLTFMIPPPGEGLCRKADDQVRCDQAAIFPSKNGRAGRYSPSLGANDVAKGGVKCREL